VSFLDPGDDLSFPEQVDKLGRELDVMMRYVMKHVENHERGGKEAGRDQFEASAFSVLRFALEDWDL
jgi:hypothetical protein